MNTRPPFDPREVRSWRCFHCNAFFTQYGEALKHFGFESNGKPSCIKELEKERDDLRQTFAAVYSRLGITPDNCDGKEKVSVTVERFVNAICAEKERLAQEVDTLQKLLAQSERANRKLASQKPTPSPEGK